MGNRSSALSPQVVGDLEGSTDFSADEIRAYYSEFLKETSRGKMTLSQEEFKTAYARIFPKGDSTKFAQYVFKTFDVDGDGRVDFREFLSVISIQQNGSLEDKLAWTFDLYDLDSSGYITKDELLEMCKAIFALRGGTLQGEELISPNKLASYIMKKSDENSDGKLTKEEFIVGAISSKTIQTLLVGSIKASTSTFTENVQKT